MSEERDLAAGAFTPWMVQIRGALAGQGESDVPCGGCTACCTSSQFIHVGPDEADTLAHIPAALLFPAPRLAPGHVLLGYDEHGHCPMLIDNQCSIYPHRPRTCRTYDCRAFPAAGIGADGLIGRQARRWQFDFPTDGDRTEYEAVRSAATYLIQHPGLLPDGGATTNGAQRAVLAIEIHHVFLDHDDETGLTRVIDPDPETVRAAVSVLSAAAEESNGDQRRSS